VAGGLGTLQLLSLDANCSTNGVLPLLVTVTAEWKIMNWMIPVTLGSTQHNQETTHSPRQNHSGLSGLGNLTQVFLAPERKRSLTSPQSKRPTHFLPRINNFLKLLPVWIHFSSRENSFPAPHPHYHQAAILPSDPNLTITQYSDIGTFSKCYVTHLYLPSPCELGKLLTHRRYWMYVSRENVGLSEWHHRWLHSTFQFIKLFF
jgi:hypothetical protein